MKEHKDAHIGQNWSPTQIVKKSEPPSASLIGECSEHIQNRRTESLCFEVFRKVFKQSGFKKHSCFSITQSLFLRFLGKSPCRYDWQTKINHILHRMMKIFLLLLLLNDWTRMRRNQRITKHDIQISIIQRDNSYKEGPDGKMAAAWMPR